jgi:hypothetical protein
MNAAAKPQVSIEAFESGSIDAEAFDHDAHIYVAWLYLEQYPVLQAAQHYTDALKRLTRQLGIPGKYHETITWFFMFLIDERRHKSSAQDWFAFRRQNDDIFARGDHSILNRYYRRETLAGDRARQSFLLPDRLATQA